MDSSDIKHTQLVMFKDYLRKGDVLISKNNMGASRMMYVVDAKGYVSNDMPATYLFDEIVAIYRKVKGYTSLVKVAWCKETKDGKEWAFIW